jgi:hypothetical protein
MTRADFLNVRLTSDLKGAIQRAAQDEERPSSSLVRLIIREWLQAHGYLGESSDAGHTRKQGR